MRQGAAQGTNPVPITTGVRGNASVCDWKDDFSAISVDNFQEVTGPNLPPSFDVNTATPLDYFKLLFPPRLISDITKHTNSYAAWVETKSGKKDPYWTETTDEEISAYLGLNILIGLDNKPSYSLYWNRDPFIGNQGFISTMPQRRYEKLTQYFHVSDRESEPARGSPGYDRLYKVRPVIECLQENFKEFNQPSREQAIDEGMIAFTGKLSFKQYLPAKPIKRGIKVWMRCDSIAESCYLNEFNIYLGKGDGGVTEHGLGYNVVTSLCQSLHGKYHHVFFDNYFTSKKLMEPAE